MDIQLPQILFQLVNFSVVVGALSYLLYKPVLKIFEERAKRIEAGQKAAEANLAESKKLEQLAQTVKQKAEKEAAEILEAAQQQAQTQAKKIVADAKKEGVAAVEKIKQDWEVEKTQLVKNMKAELVGAVVAASEKVIGQSLDKKAHSKLIDQEIEAIAKSL